MTGSISALIFLMMNDLATWITLIHILWMIVFKISDKASIIFLFPSFFLKLHVSFEMVLFILALIVANTDSIGASSGLYGGMKRICKSSWVASLFSNFPWWIDALILDKSHLSLHIITWSTQDLDKHCDKSCVIKRCYCLVFYDANPIFKLWYAQNYICLPLKHIVYYGSIWTYRKPWILGFYWLWEPSFVYVNNVLIF